MSEWIPSAEWATIVEHVPIVSIDLVVVCDEGVVLGKRTNQPARGEWFIPDGRVRKRERVPEAVHPVARDELGVSVEITEELGTYEHLYETADVPTANSKYYLANGFGVRTEAADFAIDSQYSTVRVFEELPNDLHEHTAQYLTDAEEWLPVESSSLTLQQR